jgi:vancomycin resistance protein VanW
MMQLNDLKVQIKLKQLLFSDLYKGHAFKFAGKHKHEPCFDYSIDLSQDIMSSDTFDQKLFNIKSVCEKINEYVLMPNQIFSFWKIVGNPNLSLKRSRSIVKGQIKNELGGGICQVSGIIYYLSILASLQILERHNHTIDLYTEESRFTPLGTDATVVYGFKDLRIINNFPFAIKFEIQVIENKLIASLLSQEPIATKCLTFEQKISDNNKFIRVMDYNGKSINESLYKILNC